MGGLRVFMNSCSVATGDPGQGTGPAGWLVGELSHGPGKVRLKAARLPPHLNMGFLERLPGSSGRRGTQRMAENSRFDVRPWRLPDATGEADGQPVEFTKTGL